MHQYIYREITVSNDCLRSRYELNLSSRVGVDRLGRHGGSNNVAVPSASPGERTPSRAGEWLTSDIGSSGGSGGGSSNG